ncbi:MAG TPA: class I SAM-dependent methyltransferase [Candidatus Acidoferrales bacterium]|nr:class I SAM-dependent methyltransferase [Candidatus Acidoferrales bacterium]
MKEPYKFDPANASRLENPERLKWLPPQQLAELLDIPLNATVVDFGTGTGALVIPIAKSRLDSTFYALDEQASMLEILHAKLDAQLLSNVVPIDPEHVTALEGTIDRVLAVNVLHELKDDEMRSLGALLRPQGYALVVDWNSLVERPAGPPAKKCYSPAEAAERLSTLGFKVQAVGSFPYHHAFVARPQG